MKDFLGNEITVGCFLAKDGAARAFPSEYGLVLHEVTGFSQNGTSIKALRICVEFVHYTSDDPPKVELGPTIISNPNATVVVTPSLEIVQLWSCIKVMPDQLTPEARRLVASWLDGSTRQRPGRVSYL